MLQNLPCIVKYNQLYCTDKGSEYPDSNIDKFVDDNKALLRRMFGESQEQQVVTQTSVTIVTSFAQTRCSMEICIQFIHLIRVESIMSSS